MNLRWSWDERTRDLFRWVDPEAWDATTHDPVRLLSVVKVNRLEALAEDAGFLSYLTEIDEELTRYLQRPRWFQSRVSPLRQVGYFSPEFGISEALPQYSGGLGVLAGDHLKAASDLGVPLVGVGLFYRNGYCRQSLSLDGWQQERFPSLDPCAMALTLCEGTRVEVNLASETCALQIWRADVGRTPLYMLDADIDENSPDVRLSPPLVRRRHRAPDAPGDPAASVACERSKHSVTKYRCSTPTRGTPDSSDSNAFASWCRRA
jgi:starch phosphorylase